MKVKDITLIITRPADQASGFLMRTKDLGFQTLALPTVRIQRLPLTEQASQTVAAVDRGQFDWIVFTSSNAVGVFAEVEREVFGRLSIPLSTKIAVQGSKTKNALTKTFAREPHLMPEEFILEGLVKVFQGIDMQGQEVLFPISKKHREVLIEAMKESGAKVTLLTLYDSVHETVDDRAIKQLKTLDPKSVIFTFLSPSAFDSLIEVFGSAILNGARIATIGPVTSRAVRSHGFEVFVEAREHTEEGLARSLYEALSN